MSVEFLVKSSQGDICIYHGCKDGNIGLAGHDQLFPFFEWHHSLFFWGNLFLFPNFMLHFYDWQKELKKERCFVKTRHFCIRNGRVEVGIIRLIYNCKMDCKFLFILTKRNYQFKRYSFI